VGAVTLPDRPLVLGHRGAPRVAPENTVEAFRAAVDAGADGVEFDARLTSDGVMVVHHDPVVARLGALDGIDSAKLRREHPRIPTIDETLAALPDPSFILNVELKNDPDEAGYDADRNIARRVADWVGRNDLHDRVIVSSFDRAAIDLVRARDPRITTGLLVRPPAPVRSVVTSLAADQHDWVLPHHTLLLTGARRTIENVHDAGLRIGTWTLDSPERSRRLADAGIDAVITNVPGSVVREIAPTA
jgi:glycerophosphoryl diester phosphodiesterase